ncbi:MAG: S1 RNA-binding domain-containing protein [Bdellovibrionales bacterium]|nr:S1 RNA-binding domain-containing protein [Bdellovibrionales bacterium]
MTKKNNSFDNLFNEDSNPVKSQDFAAMFEDSLNITNKKLQVGDKFKAPILSIGKEESYVSIGSHLDGVIHNTDLLDENKQLKYSVGDSIDVVVVRVRSDEVRVTRQGSRNAPTDISNLEDAFDMELPVEGKVTEIVKGGFRVSIQGQTAFCPISQLDARSAKAPEDYIGKKFEFLITQFEGNKRNIVVSRRKLLDLQKAEHEGLWLEKHKVGDIVSGLVTRTESYGAFVDVGSGIEGLVHVSEIGFVRLKHAADGVKSGDQVQVKILKVDEEETRLKISLSIKQAGGAMDPWVQVPTLFPIGAIVDGVVEKKESFGLFVNLSNGINGLLPKSKWRDSDEAANFENKRKGDAIKVRIDELKFEERKISLGLPTEAEDESWREHQNTQRLGTFAAAFSLAQKNKK